MRLHRSSTKLSVARAASTLTRVVDDASVSLPFRTRAQVNASGANGAPARTIKTTVRIVIRLLLWSYFGDRLILFSQITRIVLLHLEDRRGLAAGIVGVDFQRRISGSLSTLDADFAPRSQVHVDGRLDRVLGRSG